MDFTKPQHKTKQNEPLEDTLINESTLVPKESVLKKIMFGSIIITLASTLALTINSASNGLYDKSNLYILLPLLASSAIGCISGIGYSNKLNQNNPSSL